jgi:hypothetical protein
MHNVLGKEDSQPQMRIDLSQSAALVCKKCGCDYFLEASKFRIISKLLTGTTQDAVIPIPIFLCANCGEVLQELVPEQIREETSVQQKSNLEL